MFEFLSKRNRGRPSMDETEEFPAKSVSISKLASAQLCIQVIQVCVSLIVMICGLAVGGVGLWALESQKEYIIISADDAQLNRLPLSMIVAGIFIALLGVIGIVGGLFTRTITGRILLGVYAFVLALLIINEIGAGVSAIYFQDEILKVFVQTAEHSLMNYGTPSNTTSTTEQWDSFQKRFKCCGASNFTSYRKVFGNDTVPASCCLPDLLPSDCDDARRNATAEETNKLFLRGCPDAVVDILKGYDKTVAVIVLVIGIAQLSGVIWACIMAYVSSKAEEKTSYSYNRLIQEQT